MDDDEKAAGLDARLRQDGAILQGLALNKLVLFYFHLQFASTPTTYGNFSNLIEDKYFFFRFSHEFGSFFADIVHFGVEIDAQFFPVEFAGHRVAQIHERHFANFLTK